MIHRIILSTFSFLALATCQNPAAKSETVTTDKVESTKIPETTSSSATVSTTTQPEMSTGLPPDEEAKRQAKLEQANSAQNQSNMVYLKEGENKFLKEYEMNVTFKKMVEDSRCPKDVNCIWEGVATAEVEVMGLATRPVTLKISTVNDARKGYSRSDEFNGYTISLAEVAPATTSSKGFNVLKGHYTIGLRIQKESSGDPSTQRGGTTTK